MYSPIGPMAYFQKELNKGKFVIQRSRSSGQYVFYPRAVEPNTGQNDLEWVPASGKGHVYASTTVYPRKGEPYNISIIQLAEGPRLMSRVIDTPSESVAIGMEVYARVEPPIKSNSACETEDRTLVFSIYPALTTV